MKSLEELNWEQFHIGDVFSVERPVARNKDNYEHGDVPFVASGAANNGVLKCCRPKNDETLDKRNCITVSPVDGSTFYQVFDFLGRGGAGSSVLLLRSPQNELLSGQFVSRMISQTCSKYTYGHMGSKESIKREIIQLPTYPDHSPDYQYMADYVERKSNDLRDRYCLYAKKRISEMGTPITVPPLNEKNWQTFIIKDIADVYSGHDIYAQERVNGKTPLVTAVGINNGVGYFVSNENNSKAEESISVVRNGASVGKAFYHKYSALYGNDCRRMKLKHSHSEFVNLFITQVIGMQNKAFSYSRKLGTERLLNLRITSHSAHIANTMEFAKVRYAQKSNTGVIYKNLNTFAEANPDNVDFIRKYLTLTRCDLFFADKAIFVEGASERLLLPDMIGKCESSGIFGACKYPLSAQYYAVIEIGGAYAHKFIPFIDFLGAPCLILTDLDSVADRKGKGGKIVKKSVVVSQGETTSNETIKWWVRRNKGLPDDDTSKIDLSDIIAMTSDDKTKGKCHIEFQTNENGLCGHSLEEAIRNVNRKRYDLGDSTSEEDLEFKGKSKTDFALDLICECADYCVPAYIKSGLTWLNNQRVLE